MTPASNLAEENGRKKYIYKERKLEKRNCPGVDTRRNNLSAPVNLRNLPGVASQS